MSKKKKPKQNVVECSHIDYAIIDSGMNMITLQRYIGLKCKDCETVWDIKLQHGKKRGYIKVRQPLKEK